MTNGRTRLVAVALALAVPLGAVTACSSSGSVGIGSPSGTEPTITVPGFTVPDVSVPDLTVPGGLKDCGTILATYVKLAVTAVRGKEAAASARETLDGIKAKLPAELQSDLATVAEAFGAIASEGITDGRKALTTQKFKDANANILSYLRDDCLPG